MMPISVVSTLSGKQVEQLIALYRNEFWCNQRKRSDVERMLNNSDIIIGAVDSTHNLVGFVRVLTDYVYKATIYDLIIHSDWRGQQLGRFLMDSVINHPDLIDVEHFDLHCLPDMYKFYQKWGFTTELGKLGFMRRFNSWQ
jgi:ribosomal protein S18 acetylase RimI-like enzyme